MEKGLLRGVSLSVILILFSVITAGFVSADVIVNEIMYDFPGADGGHEWIETYNKGINDINLSGWKLEEEGVNHALTLINGSWVIQSGNYVILADDPLQFLTDYPDFSGTLIDTSFSLGNVGETLTLRNSDLDIIDTVTYSSSWGANDNNYTLERVNPNGGAASNNWKQSTAVNGTPGVQNSVYDVTGPTISNETIYPSTVYNDDDATLNATITDTNGINTVWIEGNWNGSTVVYTTGITYVSDVYSYTVGSADLSNQETVEWRYYANDTVGNLATGTLQSFTVQNRAPTLITTIPDIVWDEDTTTTRDVSVHFSDDDGDTLTYNYINTPTKIAVAINQTTGAVTLTPDANFTGIRYINFTATDGIATTTSNGVMLNVTPVNDAPKITSTPATLTATEAIEYTYDVDATDIDSNVSQLVYSVLAPANSVVNISTGLLKWTPTAAQADSGTVAVEVKVTDPEGDYSTQEFDIDVLHVLDIIDMKVNDVSVSDNDTISGIAPGDTITVEYKLKNRFPDQSNKAIVGIITKGIIAKFNQTKLTSDVRLEGQETKTINYDYNVPQIVNDTDFSLNLTAEGVDLFTNDYSSDKIVNFIIDRDFHRLQIMDKSWSKNNLACDRTTSLTVTIVNTGNWSEDGTVTVYNAKTGTNSTQNFASLDIAEKLNVTFNNIDAIQASDDETFTITVKFFHDYYTITDSIELLITECFDAASLQNAIPIVQEDIAPAWQIDLTNFTYGDTTGLVYGIETENISLIDCSIIGTMFSCGTPAADAYGTSVINMSITAGSTVNYEIFNVDVAPVNDAPAILAIPPITFDEDGSNNTVDLDDYVSDPEDDDSAITWAVEATNVSVVIDSETHILDVTAAADWNGAETITLTATDTGGLSINTTLTVIVNPVNDLPVISSYYPTQTNPRIADISGLQLFNVSAYDPDGSSLTYDWTKNGVSDGIGTSYTATNLNIGEYDIDVTVTDADGNSTSHSWTLTVSDEPVTDNYDFSYGQTLENATNVTIEHATYGGIYFGTELLNLSDVVDLDNFVLIGSGSVGIDTLKYPQLKNKPAHIIMKGLGSESTPIIYYNTGYGISGDTVCPETRCTNINYNPATGVLEFDVTGFSTYFVTGNIAPIADAGADQDADVNDLVTLDGSGSSDENVNDTLAYAWTQVSGTAVTLSNYTDEKPTFTPAQEGTYIFQLVVNDGTIDSQPDNVTVTAFGGILDITDVKLRSVDKNRKLKPGETLTVEIDIENNGDIDIEDIELEIWFEDSNGNKLKDDDNDVIEEESDFDLDEGDDEGDLDDDDVEFEFEMPYDVEDGDTYTVYVQAEGEQSNDSSIKYRDRDTSETIEFEREKHELVIYKAILNPHMIKCSRSVNIDIGIRDIGEKDEDDVELTILNGELSVSIRDKFDIEEDPDDNEYKATYAFEVSDEIAEGIYPIFIDVEYDDGDETATETVNLEIQDCEKVRKVKEEVIVRRAPVGAIPGVAEPIKPPVTEISFTDTTGYMFVLTLGLIIMTGLVVFTFGAVIINLRKR